MSITRKRVNHRMSHIVVHSDVVYLAGMVALDRPRGSVAEQTRDTLGQIDIRLAEAGTDKSQLLSAIVWLADLRSFDEMNEVWDAWVVPGATPARACVEAKLAGPANAYAVEIMVTAAFSADKT